MPKLVKCRGAAFSGLAVALFLAPSPLRAEMEVLESSVPGLEPGAVLADDAKLKLPDGTTIRLLIKATGSTKQGNRMKYQVTERRNSESLG